MSHSLNWILNLFCFLWGMKVKFVHTAYKSWFDSCFNYFICAIFHWCLKIESMLLCFAPSSLSNPEREHRRRMFLGKSVYIVLSLSFSVKAPHHMFNIWVEFPSRTRACEEREEKITASCVPLGGQHWVLSATLLTPGKHWWDQSYAVIWCCTGGFHSSQTS